MVIYEPETIEDLRAFVAAPGSLRIVEPSPLLNAFRLPGQADRALSMMRLPGPLEPSPADQVVRVGASRNLGDVQAALRESGQTLPIWMSDLGHPLAACASQSIGALLSMNLPHALMEQHGSWRDWVLGATWLRADGRHVKAGSSVVKNVAGYDLHRLMVGARQTLGILVEVTLRTTPLSALSDPKLTTSANLAASSDAQWTVRRWSRSQWREAREGLSCFQGVLDDASCCSATIGDPEPESASNEWLIRANQGTRNLELKDLATLQFMRELKRVYDPENKLNPGEMGAF